MKIIIIKIGGSVIADKNKRFFFDKKKAERIADVLLRFRKKDPDTRFVIGNGGGSFGHLTAKKYELGRNGSSSEKTLGISYTHERVVRLNQMFTNVFIKKRIPLLSFSPNSFLFFQDQSTRIFYPPMLEALDSGFDIGFFGDVVLGQYQVFKIFSTEQIIFILAREFLQMNIKIKAVVLLSDVMGVFNSKGELVGKIDKDFDPKKSFFYDSKVDITGGMRAKVEYSMKLADLGLKVFICSLDAFSACLEGRKGRFTVVNFQEKYEQ